LIAYKIYREGRTEAVEAIDPAWLKPESGVRVWADVRQPTEADGRVLQEVFGLHPLAVQDALQSIQNPKIETYAGLLYVVLHGIDFRPESDTFETHDTDFFVTRIFLVTVHDGQRRSIERIHELCTQNEAILREGPVALMHRIIDTMVDHYRPEVEELETRLDEIEERVLEQPSNELTRQILAVKRDIAQMRRIVLPQRDAVGRLARREFDLIDQEMSYRFRDVYDSLVRLSDDAMIFQERVTGILDAHLAAISNQLALSSQRLAAVATIFGTLTVLSGVYGMNVPLPTIGGSESSEFWWILGLMAFITVALYAMFRRMRWL
jgi:magnesium transporter